MKIGTYYYPDQWPRAQWQRDFDNIAKMGLRIVHMAEFAWGTIEPRPGEFHLDWLADALEMARARGLDVILCTPTAVLPAWMVQQHPDLLITGLRFGGRRHAVHTSPVLHEYARRVVARLAEAFGGHPSVIGWQIDNELAARYDQHDCTHEAFRGWLRRKYGSLDELNRAWGCAFWNTFYTDWRQIQMPVSREPDYRNPHQQLDAARFWSWSFAEFTRLQADVLRPRIGDRFITTNFMPLHLDCDPRDFESCLNLWSWDSYPVSGWDRNPADQTFRIADPAGIGLVHDHMASFNGRWALMEIQPGQVNWSGVPVRLFPGAVRLWLWTAFAHGARFITTYRFRRPRFGAELWHDALVGPDGITPTPGGREFMQTIREIDTLPKHDDVAAGPSTPAVGIVVDFDALWEMTGQPQARRWNQRDWLTRWYSAAMRMGLPIRVVHPDRDIPPDVKLLVAPGVQLVDAPLLQRWERFALDGGQLVLTCRTGLMDRNGQIFEAPWASAIRPLIGASIEAYDSLPVDLQGAVEFAGRRFAWGAWGDQLSVDAGTDVLATYADQFYAGAPAATRRDLGAGGVTYCGVDGSVELLEALLRTACAQAAIPAHSLPHRTQLLDRDGLTIFLNYADQPQITPAPAGAVFVVGGPETPPAGVSAWRG